MKLGNDLAILGDLMFSDGLLYICSDLTKNLKYDFIVAPNADPDKINIMYDGLEKIYIDNSGGLKCVTSVNLITEHKPFAFQIINGKKKEVTCFYKLEENVITFELHLVNCSKAF